MFAVFISLILFADCCAWLYMIPAIAIEWSSQVTSLNCWQCETRIWKKKKTVNSTEKRQKNGVKECRICSIFGSLKAPGIFIKWKIFDLVLVQTTFKCKHGNWTLFANLFTHRYTPDKCIRHFLFLNWLHWRSNRSTFKISHGIESFKSHWMGSFASNERLLGDRLLRTYNLLAHLLCV